MEHDQSVCLETSAATSRRPSPEAVKEQLERLLASPRFASSSRCQLLLRHVVEASLRDNGESLKERNIGIEVFHRDPAYDTNADPTVRVAASEIRKKLAQYYYEPGNQDQVRIELPTGSYSPQFSFSESAAPAEPASPLLERPASDPANFLLPAADALARSHGQKPHLRGKFFWIFAPIVLLAAAATIWAWVALVLHNPVRQFWAEVLNSKSPVLLCPGQFGTNHGSFPALSGGTGLQIKTLGPNGVHTTEMITVVLGDAVALADVAVGMRSVNKPFFVRNESSLTYEDLQKGPVVLVGAYNNSWTLHFNRSLRFYFEHDSDGFLWIADRNNPAAKLGLVKLSQDARSPEEYALVARFLSPETKQPTVILAGLSPAGTLAAAQFATNSQYLGDFLKAAPSGWQSKNLEVVIATNVIDDQPGPPRVVASALW